MLTSCRPHPPNRFSIRLPHRGWCLLAIIVLVAGIGFTPLGVVIAHLSNDYVAAAETVTVAWVQADVRQTPAAFPDDGAEGGFANGVVRPKFAELT